MNSRRGEDASLEVVRFEEFGRKERCFAGKCVLQVSREAVAFSSTSTVQLFIFHFLALQLGIKTIHGLNK